MTKTMALLALLAMAGAGLIGCSSECVSACEDAEDAHCWDGVSCDRFCENVEEIAAESGCEEEADDVFACTADVNDVCSIDQRCLPEENRFVDCSFGYCIGHAADCALLAH